MDFSLILRSCTVFFFWCKWGFEHLVAHPGEFFSFENLYLLHIVSAYQNNSK